MAVCTPVASWEEVGSPSASSPQTGSDLGFSITLSCLGERYTKPGFGVERKKEILLSLFCARHCAKRVLCSNACFIAEKLAVERQRKGPGVSYLRLRSKLLQFGNLNIYQLPVVWGRNPGVAWLAPG